jgi:ribosomal protein S27AE
MPRLTKRMFEGAAERAALLESVAYEPSPYSRRYPNDDGKLTVSHCVKCERHFAVADLNDEHVCGRCEEGR